MKIKTNKKDIEILKEIYQLIRVDTEQAWNQALAAMEKYKSAKLTYPYAMAQSLVYIIAIIIRNKMTEEIDAEKLIAYFEKNDFVEDASLLMTNVIFHKRNSGKMEEAMAMDAEYVRLYGDGATFEQKINRMISNANFNMMRNLDKMAQVNEALRIEALLRARNDGSAWYRSSLSAALQFRAEALSHTAEVEKARAAIDESVALVDVPGVSLQYIYTAYYFKGNIAAVAGRTDEALQSYYYVEKRFAGQTFYDHLLIFIYLQIFKQLNEKFSKPNVSDKQKKELLNDQLKYIALSHSLLAKQSRPYLVAYLSLSEARLMRVTGEYDRAISCLAKALRIFVKNKITNHIIDIYEEAQQIYQAWAEKDHNYLLYRKSIRALKRAHNLTYKYNQTEGKEKMDALITQYELRQKELNEKLLHQKMDAMNKEIQMTALNLHEKIMVLDELKAYVTSLKKKGQETNQLIKIIAKKIDTVIITEHDKSTLQQKMDETNAEYFRILSERYPSLRRLDIRMCALIKTGMTNKELAKVYGQSEKSYEQHRYRIKKKLALGKNDNLVKHLLSLS
jgi:DNA-binding CsgD family transcriptional regulator